MNYLQRSTVMALHRLEPDKSHKALAEVVGISESSVTRILRMHVTDVKQTTEALMQSAALDRLENWDRACEVAAEKGYHQPSKDWLEAAKLTEPKPVASVTVDARPTISLSMNFGLGALKAYPAAQPAIDVTPEPPKD